MRSLLIITLILLWLESAWGQVLQPAVAGAAPGGKQTLTLLKPDGTPAAGATVLVRAFQGSAFFPGGSPRMVSETRNMTDTRGEVVITVPPGGGAPYRPYSSYVLIIAPGCCITALPASEFLRSQTLTLLPAATMEMTVTAAGTPAAGAEVVLCSVVDIFHFNNPACGVSTPELIVHGGADGVARLPLINTGRFAQIATTSITALVALTGNGDVPSWGAYPVQCGISPKAVPVTVALKPALACSGTVITAAGKPVPGVVVSHASLPLPPVRTDMQGCYRLGGIPQRARNVELLQIIHPDYAVSRLTVTLPGAAPAVVLRSRVNVRGRVIDAATGAPLTGVFTLRVNYPAGSGAPASQQFITETYSSGADGAFLIRIPPQAEIAVSGQGYAGRQVIDVPLAGAVIVEVKVMKGGQPVEDIRR